MAAANVRLTQAAAEVSASTNGTVRVTQAVAEVAAVPNGTSRLTQVVAEVAAAPNGTSRLTQVVAEVAAVPNGTTRLSQAVAEVAVVPIGTTRLSQTVAEVSATTLGTVRMSQIALELCYLLSPPRNVTATGLCGAEIDVTWTSAVPYASYNVYRGTSMGGPYTLLGSTSMSTMEFLDTPGVPWTRYYYVVQGVWLGLPEAFSAEAIGIGLAPPPAPDHYLVIGQTRRCKVTWAIPDPMFVVDTVNIYRSLTTESETLVASGVDVNAGVYVDRGLTNGTTYYYKIAFVNRCGIGTLSLEQAAQPACCENEWASTTSPGRAFSSNGAPSPSTWSGGALPASSWSSGASPGSTFVGDDCPD